MSTEYLETTVDKFIFRVKVGYLYSEAGVWVDYDAVSQGRPCGANRFPPAGER